MPLACRAWARARAAARWAGEVPGEAPQLGRRLVEGSLELLARGRREDLDLQDADGWRLVCAVWHWGSAAGGVVSDLGRECGRHVVVVVGFDLGVSDVKLSGTDES